MTDNGLRIHEALKLAIGFGYPGGLHYYDELDPHGMGPLLYRLTDGAWHATGRRTRDGNREPLKPEVLRPEWWRILIPDADTNSASGGRMEFWDIRIFRGAPSPAAKKTSAAEVECFKWLTELIAEGEKTKNKLEYRDEYLNQFGQGLSDRAFKRAWAKALEPIPEGSSWRKSGPTKSS